MNDDNIIKTYVRPDNTAVLTCPKCGLQKTINTKSFDHHKSRVKVKCGCKNVFVAHLEFRKRPRKRTYLRGSYVNHSQNEAKGNIIVTNVSISGLEFTSIDVPNFRVDDELTLEFTLDDEHLSVIRKEATVKGVHAKSVGCEFHAAGEYSFDGALGFYINN
jgi:hypothetical protein